MYLIRYNDLKGAIDPQRRLVKLSASHLWKAPSPEGTSDWQPGHEFRSDALGISLFTTGTDEILHYHESTWEIYQVLEGRLEDLTERPVAGRLMSPCDCPSVQPASLNLPPRGQAVFRLRYDPAEESGEVEKFLVLFILTPMNDSFVDFDLLGQVDPIQVQLMIKFDPQG